MNAMRAAGLVLLMALLALSCSRADSTGQSTSMDSPGQPHRLACDNCFMLHALDRYLALPTRYAVRRSPSDGCLVFTAPFSDVAKELGTSQYSERLRTESGLIRYCDRAVLDRDVAEIIEKAGQGISQNDGEVAIRSWSPAEMKTPFTATYFSWKNEGLLIFDLDKDFAEKAWREGIRD
jgi:hypothetical protein